MIRLLLVGVVLASFCLLLPLAFAQEAEPLAPGPSPSPVDYSLPYPGILPDHPLYIIKQLRDWLLLNLITNPVRKVEFQMLLADKHLNMTLFLMNKNKPDLAVTTLERGVSYLKGAETELLKIKSSDQSAVANLKNRLEKSFEKHLQEVEKISSNNSDPRLTQLLTQIQTLQADFLRNK